MDLESALSVCRQVLNQYQAFKTLHEALETAVLAQQLSNELKNQNARLAEDIAKLKGEKQAAEDEMTLARKEREAILAANAKSLDDARKDLQFRLDQADLLFKEKQAQLDGLDEELAAGRARIQKELAEWQVQADQEEARLKAARETLAALKDKL